MNTYGSEGPLDESSVTFNSSLKGQKLETAAQLNPDLQAPIAKGAVIGKVVATSGGKPVAEAPLVAQAEVERAGFLLRMWQHLLRLFGSRGTHLHAVQ